MNRYKFDMLGVVLCLVFLTAVILASCQTYQPPGGDLWLTVR